MLTRTVFRIAAVALLAFGLAAPAVATPMVYSQALGFSTGTQSLWGPGKTSASFGASGGASVHPPFLPEIGGAYNFSASAGTASASLNGTLSASYDDFVHQGTTSIGVGFNPTSGSFASHLGASFDVTGYVHDIPFYGPWDFCIYCNNKSLDPSLSYTPVFGTQRSASDSFGIAGVGPDIGVASAQLTLNANQTTYFRPDSLFGALQYTNRDSGLTRSVMLSLTGTSFLDVNLDQPGIWDFTFTGLDIADTFHSTIGSNLSVDINVIGLIDQSFPFGSIPLLNTPSFGLDFASLGPLSAFSILVPEPGTGLLLVSGLLGLAAFGRRRC